MPDARILFVDDEPSVLAAFERSLRKDFSFDTAEGGTEALAMLRECGPYAVIVADMQMPGMNGVELLEIARATSPETIRIMLTGNADQQTAIDAVNHGAVFSFLSKPCGHEELKSTLQKSLHRYQVGQVERELLESTLSGSVKVLTEVLSMVDPVSFGRGQKLRDSMKVFGRFLQLSSTWELEIAAMLSHLGHISIPLKVLRKIENGMDLTPREQTILEKSPQVGHDLLIGIPRMEGVAKIVLYQQKRYDGAGFPSDGVAGAKIPAGARLLKILHDRALLEEDGVVKQKAFQEMQSRSGSYDPELLAKCFDCFQTFLENAVSAEIPVRSITVKELKAGDILVSDVRTSTGVLLVGAGNRLTDTIVERLINYAEFDGVKEPVYVQ